MSACLPSFFRLLLEWNSTQGVQNLIHDNNKKVRTAFVGLLLAVKGVKSIRYYQVANVDHILARLSEDHLK